ncbi:hypothetical protein [Amycolatopsis sp. PS_44_ISF1]|uniref:glycosyltransferase n=1 Tax=Amycolatopsis sp. PS_44_ISF1 TaxID=2974917 RepID=UPI0028DD9007|nr:hypothetical protein [Amycolatopsis sp. PS_44_ISF1]MDT8915005.1 hypothetical protein [Amycolatopsis sp. PS_44_ISF1]
MLSRAAAFVTHAGMGGVAAALYYGVPMIAVPFTAEQEFAPRASKTSVRSPDR